MIVQNYKIRQGKSLFTNSRDKYRYERRGYYKQEGLTLVREKPQIAMGVEDLVNTPVAGSTFPTLMWTEPKSLADKMRLVHELSINMVQTG